MIIEDKLKGHEAPVLCLDLSSQSKTSSSSLLLSGSEDGTARLWDLRESKRRSCLCIKVPGGEDVLSAVFVPPIANETPCESTTSFGRDCSVYLGVENSVLEYDLRNAESPVVVSDPSKNWSGILQNQDEVNQIALALHDRSRACDYPGTKRKKNAKKKGRGNKKRQQHHPQAIEELHDTKLYIAACDDAGKVRWTESLTDSSKTAANENSTILHHDSNGVAVVPSCAFRPIDKRSHCGGMTSLELASGGTDCKIHLWDVFRPKKPISSFLVQPKSNEVEHSKPQLCNPPYVYSLAWSNDGKSLAAGFGDGTVGVFEIDNRTLVQRQLLTGNESSDGTMYYAHDSSVASVVYPSFSVTTGDRIVCSAGSSGSIVFWDLGKPNDDVWGILGDYKSETNVNDTVDEVSNLFHPSLLNGLRTGNPGFYNCKDRNSLITPRILFDIAHGHKINWVTRAAPSCDSSSDCNDTIFVADTSREITSYTIPF